VVILSLTAFRCKDVDSPGTFKYEFLSDGDFASGYSARDIMWRRPAYTERVRTIRFSHHEQE
jgi:hypothetical protein